MRILGKLFGTLFNYMINSGLFAYCYFNAKHRGCIVQIGNTIWHLFSVCYWSRPSTGSHCNHVPYRSDAHPCAYSRAPASMPALAERNLQYLPVGVTCNQCVTFHCTGNRRIMPLSFGQFQDKTGIPSLRTHNTPVSPYLL